MASKIITFKGVTSATNKVIITAPPMITHSNLNTEEYTIPGRDGTLYGANSYRSSAQITVKMALATDQSFSSNVSKYQKQWRTVRQWLQGNGKLIIGDAPDSYFEVQKVTINTDERVILNYGNLEVIFTVFPYEFLNSGDSVASSYTNDADPSMPLYKISGSGSGVLTVNGNTMSYTIDSSGVLYIDTRRMIAYNGSNQNMNSQLTGDYEKIRMQSGANTISVTTGTLQVYPKWGYNI